MTAKSRIKKYLETKKISNRKFAEMCGFSHSIIQNEDKAIGSDKNENDR